MALRRPLVRILGKLRILPAEDKIPFSTVDELGTAAKRDVAVEDWAPEAGSMLRQGTLGLGRVYGVVRTLSSIDDIQAAGSGATFMVNSRTTSAAVLAALGGWSSGDFPYATVLWKRDSATGGWGVLMTSYATPNSLRYVHKSGASDPVSVSLHHTGNQLSLGTTPAAARDALQLASVLGIGATDAVQAPTIADFKAANPAGLYRGVTNTTANNPIGASPVQGFVAVCMVYASDRLYTVVFPLLGTWFGWYQQSNNTITWRRANDATPPVTVSASRALVITDNGAYLRTTTALTITVPTNAAVPFPIGTEITVRARQPSGVLTIGAASGVTLIPPHGGTLTMETNMTVTLKKVSADAWDVIGQTVPA